MGFLESFGIGFVVLIVLSLLISSVGFYKYVYFISLGYGFSVAAMGVALFVMYTDVQNIATMAICVLFLIYGCRLGGYLLIREIKSASYRSTMKKEIKDGKEQLEDALNSIEWCINNDVDEIDLFPINVKPYTLYAALEPCPMCMGTIVMGGIRNVVIGTKDAYGGAMGLLEKSEYLKGKNINVVWMPQEYGEVQRGFQALKELLYNTDEELLKRMMADFSVYNKKGVLAAKELIDEGLFDNKQPNSYSVEEIFDRLMLIIER